jgi:hypothetical protein
MYALHTQPQNVRIKTTDFMGDKSGSKQNFYTKNIASLKLRNTNTVRRFSLPAPREMDTN